MNELTPWFLFKCSFGISAGYYLVKLIEGVIFAWARSKAAEVERRQMEKQMIRIKEQLLKEEKGPDLRPVV